VYVVHLTAHVTAVNLPFFLAGLLCVPEFKETASQ
jgi:hypothetical protein